MPRRREKIREHNKREADAWLAKEREREKERRR